MLCLVARCALLDCHSTALNSVYAQVVDRLPVYMTSSNPLNAKNMGFVGGKIPCPYGPSAGDEGLRKNVEFFKAYVMIRVHR